jgi:3-hydroxybutyryl-CoA dehydrogenase
MPVKKILIVGSGFMGSGIAHVLSLSGYAVLLNDLEMSFLRKGMASIESDMDYLVQKEKLTAEKKREALGRISCTTDLSDAKDCDLVIEAAPENKEIKSALFTTLDAVCPERTIFATNTSSLPVTELAAVTKRPELFVGMHFFSPVPRMKLVEIINGLKTSPATTACIQELTRKIGKVGVLVKDGPGFLVNRISAAMRNEAYAALAEGVASIEDIDLAIRHGLGHPMGPFELADFTGLDIGLAVMETMSATLRDPKWRPSLLLRKLVVSGDLGRKTGKGWYDYTGGEKKARTDLNL